MNREKDKRKPSALREACARAGITVAELARRIKRARATCYFAWENPTRHSLAFALMQKELAHD
jgi:hypothetical protein